MAPSVYSAYSTNSAYVGWQDRVSKKTTIAKLQIDDEESYTLEGTLEIKYDNTLNLCIKVRDTEPYTSKSVMKWNWEVIEDRKSTNGYSPLLAHGYAATHDMAVHRAMKQVHKLLKKDQDKNRTGFKFPKLFSGL